MGIPYFHIDVFKRIFALFREACEKAGYKAHPEQMGWGVPIYVAETDAQAREEFEPHFWYFQNKLIPGLTLAPPGYTSAQFGAAHQQGASRRQDVHQRLRNLGRRREGLLRHRRQPGDGRREARSSTRSEIGCGNMLGLFQLGDMPHEKARENARRYARGVKPLVNEALPNSRVPLPGGDPVSARRAGSGR